MLTLYTSKTCAWCPRVKQFLGIKKAEFTEVDVTDDQKKRTELEQMTGLRTVPVLINENNNFAVGYNPTAIMRVLQS